MKVKDCMCDDVCCVKPNAKVQEVAKLMAQNHIGCVAMYILVKKMMKCQMQKVKWDNNKLEDYQYVIIKIG